MTGQILEYINNIPYFEFGYGESGFMFFKDEDTYNKRWYEPCYVPEGEKDNEDWRDIKSYTHMDLLRMCNGNGEKCDKLFSICAGLYPETILEQWGEIEEND